MPRLDQAHGHRAAHLAQAKEADVHSPVNKEISAITSAISQRAMASILMSYSPQG
jgi:hypothetical protein